MKPFESPAEREAFPIINTIAVKHKLKLVYQKEFGYKSGGYTSREEWCYDNDYKYNPNYGDDDDWDDSSWESSTARADFCFPEIKLIVEIDGKNFHKDKIKETKRDTYLKCQGYSVLHIPAFYVYKNIPKMKDLILEKIPRRLE